MMLLFKDDGLGAQKNRAKQRIPHSMWVRCSALDCDQPPQCSGVLLMFTGRRSVGKDTVKSQGHPQH